MHSPWWTSADFWTIIGSIVTILTLVGSVAIWIIRAMRERRRSRALSPPAQLNHGQVRSRTGHAGATRPDVAGNTLTAMHVGEASPQTSPPIDSGAYRVKHNLPPRGEFIGREREKLRVFDGLDSAYPLVAIEGLGGMGKTALATEIAWLCAGGPHASSSPQNSYEAIIWTQDRHGELTLNEVLDTIGRVLGYPYVSTLPMPAKLDKVLQCLRQMPCLVIIDNLDTVEDESISEFITGIPEPPSKGLITSREKALRGAWAIGIGKLDPGDAFALIRKEGIRLGLQTLIKADQPLLRAVYEATGGNPLAIRLTAGQLKGGAFSVDRILQSLIEADDEHLFLAIFDRSWNHLLANDEYSRRVLMAMSLHSGASGRDAVEAGSDIHHAYLRTALKRLVELSLVDTLETRRQSSPRFELHTLTRAFVRGHLEKDAVTKSEIEDRLIDFYLMYATTHADTYGNMKNTRQLELERRNILTFAEAAYASAKGTGDQHRWNRVVRYADALSSYLWGRGYLRDYLSLCVMAAEAAQVLADSSALSKQYASISRIHLRFGNTKIAMEFLHKCEAAVDPHGSDAIRAIPNRLRAQIAALVGDYASAESLLRQVLNVAPLTVNDEGRAATLIELGSVAESQGRLDEARVQFEKALELDEQLGAIEGQAISLSHLGNAVLELGDYGAAKQYYERGLALAEQVDRLSTIGRCQMGLARICAREGDALLAYERAVLAEDSFLRLGMTQMAEEARLLAASSQGRLSQSQSPIRRASLTELLVKYKAIIFDCDDTIIATAKTRWAILIRTAASFGHVLDEATIRAAWGSPFNELIRTIVPTIDFEDFVAAYRSELRALQPEPTRGAKELLAYLSGRGVQMQIITSSSRDLIVQELEQLELLKYFSNISGYEQTQYHKPDPRVLHSMIDRLESEGYQRDDILYIGDAVRDFEASAGNGIGFIAVLSGLDTKEGFLSAGLTPERIVDSLQDLLK